LQIAVSASFRRRGIGDILLERLIADARTRGAASIFLEVRSQNAPAIAMYEKRGFQRVGKRPKYYDSPVEDALILRRTLTQGENE
jgi:ribosomal-protein-alanine N-acetyltransferase